MTANVTVETMRRDNVLRVPNAALRFKPTSDTYALLGQSAPAADDGGAKGGPSSAGTASGPSIMNARFERTAKAGTAGRVWVISDGTLTAVDVRLGAGDGSYTELLEPTIAEGSELVWSVATATQKTTSTTTSSSNPFLGTQPRPPMGPPPSGTRPG